MAGAARLELALRRLEGVGLILLDDAPILASRGGFEPPTCRLGGGGSFHLSYRDELSNE